MAKLLLAAANDCLALLRGDGAGLRAVPGFADLLVQLRTQFPAGEDFEWACSEMREVLLDRPAGAAQEPLVELAAALAIQMFRTEYVFAEGAAETARVGALAARIAEYVRAGNPPPGLELAVLAAYRPLHALEYAAELAALQSRAQGPLGELVRIQLLEPQEEHGLRDRVRALTPIADPTSRAVQAQYESNPYPRWDRLPGAEAAPVPAGAVAERHLIAGCGTGRQALSAALAAPHADVLAVDLSTSSLAYALRKAAQYGLKNVTFAHADILALPATGMRFDAISCVGVVHHMDKPVDGLRALRALMKHDRGLKVALYTESGRQGVVAAIRLREEYSLPATLEGIREFRQIVAALPEGHAARELMTYEDFYSVSGCRDLAFHVMEHRYTLPQVAALAAEAGLGIEAILATRPVQERFLARYPDPAAAADIEAWHRFETENPGVFGSMYRFMLSRI